MYFKGKFRFFSFSLFPFESVISSTMHILFTCEAQHNTSLLLLLLIAAQVISRHAKTGFYFIFFLHFYPLYAVALTNLYCHPVHSSTRVQVQAFSTMTSVCYSTHVIWVSFFSVFLFVLFFNHHVTLTDRFVFFTVWRTGFYLSGCTGILGDCLEFSCCPLRKTGQEVDFCIGRVLGSSVLSAFEWRGLWVTEEVQLEG